MRLNRFEKALMNNPIRGAFQRWYEAPLLERLGGRVDGLDVLEIGCGRGVGTELILTRFGARFVSAIDLDEDMVTRAQRRLSWLPPERLELAVGDVANIAKEDRSFDAVFDFGMLHHVPDWQAALSEIRRVLRPGGRFFFEEVTAWVLDTWLSRRLTVHPKENRFSAAQLTDEMRRLGLRPDDGFKTLFFGGFVFGAALRSE